MLERRLLVVAAMAYAVVVTPAAAHPQANNQKQKQETTRIECLNDESRVGRHCAPVPAAQVAAKPSKRDRAVAAQADAPTQADAAPARSDVSFIPNPPGTWRVHRSCAHRLAAYWGLGRGLDKVSTWKSTFARVSSPGVGVAAVRRGEGHIMGIIGGGPGAWRVADFNSGGHRNRSYTVADFSGYYFVDPRRKLASK